MGRPSRTPDRRLAEQVRAFMRDNRIDGSELAMLLDVDPATVSRSLSSEAFSRGMRERVVDLVVPQTARTKLPHLLQESLHLLAISDRLRERAEAMVRQAIDLVHEPK
jgi:hypothetical protein